MLTASYGAMAVHALTDHFASFFGRNVFVPGEWQYASWLSLHSAVQRSFLRPRMRGMGSRVASAVIAEWRGLRGERFCPVVGSP